MARMIAACCLLAILVGTAVAQTFNNVGFKTLLRSGESYSHRGTPLNSRGLGFGQQTDKWGKPVFTTDMTQSHQVAFDPDYNTFIRHPSGKIFMVTNFEWELPSNQYISMVEQDPATGLMTVVSSEPVDWSAWDGVIGVCAGAPSPWGTSFAGEEGPPDGRAEEAYFSTATTLSGSMASDALEYGRYFGLYNLTANATLAARVQSTLGSYVKQLTLQEWKNVWNAYKYGWILDVGLDSNGKQTARKIMTMGRLRYEEAVCHDDGLTCYSFEDTYNAATIKTVFAKKNDPSSSTIYAAKFNQVSDNGLGGVFNLEWIRLASATQAELETRLKAGLKFSDMFETATPTGATCPSGFKSVNSYARLECLKVKPGQEKWAAYFETNRYAGYVGGTVEVSRWEGYGYDRKKNVMYGALTIVAGGMRTNDSSYDIGGHHHINVAQNDCGCVYRITLDKDNSWTRVEGILCGKPLATPDAMGNRCDVSGIASPDNLAFHPPSTLYIYEDTSRHVNNMMWAYDVDKKTLTRILAGPYGAEITAGAFVERIGKWSYAMATVQHPFEGSYITRLSDMASSGRAATVGYMGPFPSKMIKAGKSIMWNELPVPSGTGQFHISTSGTARY